VPKQSQIRVCFAIERTRVAETYFKNDFYQTAGYLKGQNSIFFGFKFARVRVVLICVFADLKGGNLLSLVKIVYFK